MEELWKSAPTWSALRAVLRSLAYLPRVSLVGMSEAMEQTVPLDCDKVSPVRCVASLSQLRWAPWSSRIDWSCLRRR